MEEIREDITKEPADLKDALTRLEGVLARLESGEEDLETSFSTYEEGLRLVRFANAQIDRVEKKCLVLEENGELHEL
ncbi:MAG: exodeoxyribonuclease VII small subunit [Lachnospiraceae bacterium]|nr:exodeoxyribonuclease VII small subunit [Lachnospiraceae bacterium]MBQ1514833.1 exodeoxyribonuclease VII small subunit [Lachnospiraceae bacterium]MBQ9464584.1 exodeoxyribonuclease VII small subunit [Lachnospiraceae bacterium]